MGCIRLIVADSEVQYKSTKSSAAAPDFSSEMEEMG